MQQDRSKPVPPAEDAWEGGDGVTGAAVMVLAGAIGVVVWLSLVLLFQ